MHWHLLSRNSPTDLPRDGQDIFCCISEGEGLPFTAVYRMCADISALQDLLSLYPDWQILWQPCVDLSPPPVPQCIRKE